MLDSQRTAALFTVIKNPHSLEILQQLIQGNKKYSFFSSRHNKNAKINHPLLELRNLGLIKKHLNIYKIPIGYSITDDGRWTFHACVNFGRTVDRHNVD